MNEANQALQSNKEVDISDEDTKKGLPDWDNLPTIKDFSNDFDNAKPAHETQTTKIKTWIDNLNVEGSAKIKKVKGRSSVAPKLIRKQAEWRYASLSEPFLSTEDIFNTAPVSFEDKQAAIQNGLVLNNQFNTKINKVSFIDEYIRTAVDEGTVIVQTGWDFEEEERVIQEPVFRTQVVTDIRKRAELQIAGQPPVEQIQIGTRPVTKMVTIRNQPTVEVLNYKNVVIDPSCHGDMDKARFVIKSFETSISELERDDRYFNLDRINLSETTVLGAPDHESDDVTNFNFEDDARKLFVAKEYWGYWDIEGDNKLVPIIATYVNRTIIRMEKAPFPDKKLPFVVAQYLPVRKSVYGEPDGMLLEDNQKVVGAVTRGMIDIMGRSASGQMGIRKDALDVTNKRKFDKGMDYEFNGNVDPRQVFHMHTYPEIPKSAEVMLNMQNAEAESLTGVKAFHNGISGAALGSTATGIRSALDATSKRELDILRRLAEGIKQIGRKFISMNAEFLDEEEVVRVTNEQFIKIRRDDLEGNFDLKLSISTAEADNEKAQELAFMLQTMGNNIDPGISKMVLTDIARLRKMPTLSKQIEDYEPQPDPVAQQKALLEVELLKAQVFNEQAKGKENAVDVGLKAAKTQTEQAKAKNLNSDADKKDLDFLEQETGVKHQRDLDIKDHDRGTQLDLKAADNLFAPKSKGDENAPIPGLAALG